MKDRNTMLVTWGDALVILIISLVTLAMILLGLWWGGLLGEG